MVEHVETLIVGGGQSGLAMSYWLGQAGREHVILERDRIAERWQSERWDSLCILTPNWTISLPAYDYAGPDPDAFMGKDEVVEVIVTYAARIHAPVRTGVSVTSVRQDDSATGYGVESTAGTFAARNVVGAPGAYGSPAIPALGAMLPRDIIQVHSSAYRNPRQLPPGAVLVVGSGASGFQIVEDLLAAGRQVYFSLGRYETRVRRYRGKDSAWWMALMGQWDRTIDEAPLGPNAPRASLTGADGGHDLNIRKLAYEGATLLGRSRGVDGGKLILAPDVAETVRDADEHSRHTLALIDEYIARHGIDAPPAALPTPWPEPRELAAPISQLDLAAADITSVVWATGFRYAFEWIQVPVFAPNGEPQHRRGVTASPGFYFLGLRWLYKFKSSFLHGVGEDAEYLTEHIVARSSALIH